jgi:hypothetical protein
MIDNYAHIGGFVQTICLGGLRAERLTLFAQKGWICGLLASFIFVPNYRAVLPKRGPRAMEQRTSDCAYISCRILEIFVFSAILVAYIVSML